MKQLGYICLLAILYSTSLFAQEDELSARVNPTSSNKTDLSNDAVGTIYFIRSTGFVGSAAAFKTFIDDEFVCNLNNKKYSIHTVKPGKHTCSVQFGGKKSKEKAERFDISVEPGKDYYIQVVLETGALVNNTYCEEVTAKTAKSKMKGLKQDNKCL